MQEFLIIVIMFLIATNVCIIMLFKRLAECIFRHSEQLNSLCKESSKTDLIKWHVQDIPKLFISLDDKIDELKTQNDRSFQALRDSLEQSMKNRTEEEKPQADVKNKWISLKEAFKAPVKAVEMHERS